MERKWESFYTFLLIMIKESERYGNERKDTGVYS